jgi:putative glycosyltransferase (TIGR04348 family)
MLIKPTILIVTPYLADANNGNWRTARRWQQLLEPHYRVNIVDTINTTNATYKPDVIIALHARRSYTAIVAAKKHFPNVPLIVVLTGTDLYRDIADSTDAQHSLVLADALIVLQEDAIQYVPTAIRKKTHIVFQSATPLASAVKSKIKLNCVVVGHLRQEKSPETIFAAATLLAANSQIHITHIGDSLDDSLAKQAAHLTATLKNYRWIGALPHGLTRAAIKRAHLLIHPSIMEGGANVIVEAITAGTPVIASKMSGNIGMLGADYAGYFPVGDAAALAALLQRINIEPNLFTRLNTACIARSALFTPDEERRRLDKIICHLGEIDSPFETNRTRRA